MPTQSPDDLVYLECPHYTDSLQPGVVFVDGRLVDPIPRHRAETLCLQLNNTRIVEVAERFAQDAERTRTTATRAAESALDHGDVEGAVDALAGALPGDEAATVRRRRRVTP